MTNFFYRLISVLASIAYLLIAITAIVGLFNPINVFSLLLFTIASALIVDFLKSCLLYVFLGNWFLHETIFLRFIVSLIDGIRSGKLFRVKLL